MEKLSIHKTSIAKAAAYILNLDISYIKTPFQNDIHYFVDDLKTALEKYQLLQRLQEHFSVSTAQSPFTLLLKTIQNFYHILTDEGKLLVERFLNNELENDKSAQALKNYLQSV